MVLPKPIISQNVSIKEFLTQIHEHESSEAFAERRDRTSQMDGQTAFLHDDLKENMFREESEIFRGKLSPGAAFKLQKALYRL